jgi:hypothetical protein
MPHLPRAPRRQRRLRLFEHGQDAAAAEEEGDGCGDERDEAVLLAGVVQDLQLRLACFLFGVLRVRVCGWDFGFEFGGCWGVGVRREEGNEVPFLILLWWRTTRVILDRR